MRFRLSLRPIVGAQKLLFNYHHPFASWIYRRIEDSDAEYSHWLHSQGFQAEDSSKRFKHFTFSKFEIPNKAKVNKGDDFMLLTDDSVFITVSFFVDKAAEDFIIGLFKNQNISIFDRKYRANFVIEGVESLPDEVADQKTIRLKATSPMVIAEKRKDGTDEYLEPSDPRFAKYFALNLLSKYESIYTKTIVMDAETIMRLVNFRLIDTQKMKSKIIAIKQDKDAATKIKGYENFVFELNAPSEMIEVGYLGGFGKFTSAAGMGFCEVV